MVDINNSYVQTNNIDYCIASLNSYEDLSLDDIDYLGNLDESDLLNFTNCDDFNYNLLPDTPPETPINYNGQVNSLGSPASVSGISLTDNLPFESNFVNSPLNIANIAVTNNPITNTTLVIPQSNIVQNPTTITTCISPLLINCQPVLSTVDLNGFKLNGNSLAYTQSIDTSSISTNNYQQKSILPSQISPKLTERQKDYIKKQKLEARKLRNREAALNSRMKKQEYVDGLETNVKKLTKERDDLLAENRVLKVKIRDLENQLCNRMRLDINGNYEANKKAKISLFAVLFMVFFQVSPYLISMAPSGNNNITDMPNKQLVTLPRTNSLKIGRTLLWKADSNEISPDYYDIGDNIKSKNFNSSSNSYANMSILCKDYFNETESLRLEHELRDWLTRFKLEEKQTPPKRKNARTNQLLKSKQNNNKKLLFDSKYVPIPRLKLWMQKQKYGDDYISDEFSEESSEQLYGFDYESLMATVHRRDDTFYYLSYPSKGHLILPPISNRTDVRPRFSFLIPTFNNLSLDDSHKNSSHSNLNHNISSQMFILQIDCQVINTKVILIKDQAGFINKTDKLKPDKKMSKSVNSPRNRANSINNNK